LWWRIIDSSKRWLCILVIRLWLHYDGVYRFIYGIIGVYCTSIIQL